MPRRTTPPKSVTPVRQPRLTNSVIYYSRGSMDGKFKPTKRAAIVTEVPEYLSDGPNTGGPGYVKAVHLFIINPYGNFNDHDVPYAAKPTPGHWSWPEEDDE